jgi:hypothetical protein
VCRSTGGRVTRLSRRSYHIWQSLHPAESPWAGLPRIGTFRIRCFRTLSHYSISSAFPFLVSRNTWILHLWRPKQEYSHCAKRQTIFRKVVCHRLKVCSPLSIQYHSQAFGTIHRHDAHAAVKPIYIIRVSTQDLHDSACCLVTSIILLFIIYLWCRSKLECNPAWALRSISGDKLITNLQLCPQR